MITEFAAAVIKEIREEREKTSTAVLRGGVSDWAAYLGAIGTIKALDLLEDKIIKLLKDFVEDE